MISAVPSQLERSFAELLLACIPQLKQHVGAQMLATSQVERIDCHPRAAKNRRQGPPSAARPPCGCDDVNTDSDIEWLYLSVLPLALAKHLVLVLGQNLRVREK